MKERRAREEGKERKEREEGNERNVRTEGNEGKHNVKEVKERK